MSFPDLIALCSDAQIIPPPEVEVREELLDWLLKEFGV